VFGGVTSRGMRYVGQRLALLLVFACVLLGSAGRFDWPRAWAYLLVVLLLEVTTLSVLAALAPETLNRRGAIGAGVKPFDKAFAVLWLVLSLCVAAVAGPDAVRFHWSRLPEILFPVGAVILSVALAFGTWAMLENRHFEQFVRIQQEREHHVVTTGPYRMVRHPGYLGAIIGVLVTPGMLGSAWAFVPASLLVLLFIIRTHLEDGVLRRELPGYEEYASRTRFRLVPLVW